MGIALSGCSSGSSGGGTSTPPPTAATPAFSVAAGTYASVQSVAISSTTAGATIYYTTNGTAPTTSSTVYSGPVSVSTSETLEAIAVESGYTTSAVASAAYVINLPAATPTFSVAAGTYTSVQSVAISSTTAGATIYYTTNGTTPTTSSTVYSGPVTVSSTETLEAIAVASGYATSTVASAAYVINLPPMANAGGPYAGIKGVALSFNGSASSSPQSKTLTYAWDFGDGNTGTGASPTHTYSAWGTYSVKLTVTDTSSLSNTATVQVAVPNGRAFASQKAISGAHVYLFAANTTGYGQASVSLLSGTGQSDAIGAYVPTGADGSFFIAGDYSCTAGSQVYLYALGGTSGAGTNTASGLLAALGACPSGGSFAATPYVVMNEVSTIAAAYAFAGFATDATHVSSSGTALAQMGIGIAFANAANLETLSSGAALAVTPSGDATVPQSEINALANVLAACTVTGAASSNACSILFSLTLSGGSTGTAPTDTATAAINIAHNPTAQLTVPSGPFSPTLASLPEYTISINFKGGGLNQPRAVAIDGQGAAWIENLNGNSVTKISSAGWIVSGVSGYPVGAQALSYPPGLAIDLAGNAWVTDFPTNSVTELSSSGTVLSGTSGFTGGGLNGPCGIAIDGSNNVWVANFTGSSVTELSNAGAAITGPGGYTGGGLSTPTAIAIDGTGVVWVVDYGGNALTKMSSAGAFLSGASGFKGLRLSLPSAIALDATGNAWATSSYGINTLSSVGADLFDSNSLTYSMQLSLGLAIAIDGSGNAWETSSVGYNYINEVSSKFVLMSGYNGYGGPNNNIYGASGIAVDGAGNVWVADYGGLGVNDFIGVATPVVTPLAVGVKNNTLGARP